MKRIFFFFIICTLLPFHFAVSSENVGIVIQGVRTRSQPSTKSKIVTTLKKGNLVTILQTSDDSIWYHVTLRNRDMWVKTKYIKKIPQDDIKKGTILNPIRTRSKPTIKSRVVATLMKDTPITVIQTTPDAIWHKIIAKNKMMWVKTRYVRIFEKETEDSEESVDNKPDKKNTDSDTDDYFGLILAPEYNIKGFENVKGMNGFLFSPGLELDYGLFHIDGTIEFTKFKSAEMHIGVQHRFSPFGKFLHLHLNYNWHGYFNYTGTHSIMSSGLNLTFKMTYHLNNTWYLSFAPVCMDTDFMQLRWSWDTYKFLYEILVKYRAVVGFGLLF